MACFFRLTLQDPGSRPWFYSGEIDGTREGCEGLIG